MKDIMAAGGVGGPGYGAPMPPIIDWDEAQLRQAVARFSSWRKVAAALGMAGGSTHRVKRRAEELGLDTSHMTGNRRWDPRRLQEAVARATNWSEVPDLLGVPASELRRIRGAVIRMSIDAAHLNDRPPHCPGPQLGPRLQHLAAAAESIATAWFTMAGCTVAIPVTPCSFDLVVCRSGRCRRVQVKSTTHRDRNGRWVVNVSRRPYQRELNNSREPYDPDDIDEFFIITGSGDVYVIPVAVIAGRVMITLDRYLSYRTGSVGAFGVPGDAVGSRASRAPAEGSHERV